MITRTAVAGVKVNVMSCLVVVRSIELQLDDSQ
jgi:hypothetical protein